MGVVASGSTRATDPGVLVGTLPSDTALDYARGRWRRCQPRQALSCAHPTSLRSGSTSCGMAILPKSRDGAAGRAGHDRANR